MPCDSPTVSSLAGFGRLVMIGALLASPAVAQRADTVPLLPLELLLGRPRVTTVQVHPAGETLAVIEQDSGHASVVLYDRGRHRLRRVFRDTVRSVNNVRWSGDGQWLLTLHDRGGDEGYHLLRLDPHGELAAARDLTPFPGAEVELLGTPAGTETAIIASNHRNPKVSDVYRVHLRTGRLTRLATNPGDVTVWVLSPAGVPAAASAVRADGTLEVRTPIAGGPRWRVIHRAPADERFTLLGVDAASGEVIARTNHGRSHEVFVRLHARSGALLRATESACAGFDAGALVQTARGVMLGEACASEARQFHAHSPRLRAQIARAQAEIDAGSVRGAPASSPGSRAMEFESASADGSLLAFFTHAPTDPGRFLLIETVSGRADTAFALRPEIPRAALAPTTFHRFTARDGLPLSLLLTRSPVGGAAPQPVVLAVHGGPWTRDELGYAGETQLFANRGYTVLQVNFRGSTGLGRATVEGAVHEFGGRMSDDLLDALAWTAAHTAIDTSRVCIMGGSYGGYAALVGMTRDAARFRCGIDFAGPVDLETLVRAFPPSWQPFLPRSWYRFVGNPSDSVARERMRRASPLSRLNEARGPLLVFHGANDPRVRTEQALRVVRSWEARQLPVSLLFAGDEGHSFNQEATSLAVNRAVEEFLGRWLGGRVADEVSPGIAAALRRLRAGGDSLVRTTSP